MLCCSAAYLTPKLLWHVSLQSFLHVFLSFLLYITGMFISDIRMKSRGVNLPKSQSAASRLAHHTEQHPGIIMLITLSTLSSLIFCKPLP